MEYPSKTAGEGESSQGQWSLDMVKLGTVLPRQKTHLLGIAWLPDLLLESEEVESES